MHTTDEQKSESMNLLATQPLVWVVVLHYQAAELTRKCLNSVAGLTYENFRILLVDNGSPDSSGSSIAMDFPNADFLHLADNLGFAGGCNAAVEYCAERGASWVWLLNNDTLAEAASLSMLVGAAWRYPLAAALGAQIQSPSPTGLINTGAGEIDYWRGKTFERKQVDPRAQVTSCPWLSGCNLLIKVDVFRSLGGFDETYFLYFEDTDLSCRIHEAGYDCLLVPTARIQHLGGASTSSNRMKTWRAYYHTRNRLLFFSRHCGALSRLPAILAILLHLLRHTIVLPFRGENGRRQLKAELLGLRDFMAGKLGKATCLDW